MERGRGKERGRGERMDVEGREEVGKYEIEN